jgi:PIN domain nuclease of toxin-antitoxin system
MRLLLDTHAYLWWVRRDPKLSVRARDLIATEDIIVSAVTALELAIKARVGKLPAADEVVSDLPTAILEEGFEALSVTIEHARLAGSMPGRHRDPFDRLLAAQARIENVPLLTVDPAFLEFDVQTFW